MTWLLVGCVRSHSPGAVSPSGDESSPPPFVDGMGHVPLSESTPSGDPGTAPSVVIQGVAGQALGASLSVLDGLHAGVSGLIIVGAMGDVDDLPSSDAAVLTGLQPRGLMPLNELWDGVSRIAGVGGFSNGNYEWAGDATGDGEMDVWIGHQLRTGPFLGRLTVYDYDVTEYAIAWSPRDSPTSGFDADGDGVLDLVTGLPFTYAAWQVTYGPIAGELESFDEGGVDTADVSILGDTYAPCGLYPTSRVLWDALGPGHHAIAVGEDDYECSPMLEDGFVYDLMLPRGSQVPRSEAIATTEGAWDRVALYPMGDVDGDGDGEVFGLSPGSLSAVFESPVSGVLTPGVGVSMLQNDKNFFLRMPCGDINGDGTYELLDRDVGILFSPFSETEDMTQHAARVQLDTRGLDMYVYDPICTHHADLDGDGLEDIAHAWFDAYGGAGEVLIWYGADLVAALEGAD